MNQISVIEILLEVFLFLAISYFLFYRSWLSELGKEVAKLSTIEHLTFATENVKKEFQQQMETYKSKLNEELALKVEPLKSELSKSNITHQIQFSYLHQERAKVTVELYKKLIELHSAMYSKTRPFVLVINDAEKEENERFKRVNNALYDFRRFFNLNKIYFSSKFCLDIEDIFNNYWNNNEKYDRSLQTIRHQRVDPDSLKEHYNVLDEISYKVIDKLDEKIKDIEKVFRAILSVEDNSII